MSLKQPLSDTSESLSIPTLDDFRKGSSATDEVSLHKSYADELRKHYLRKGDYTPETEYQIRKGMVSSLKKKELLNPEDQEAVQELFARKEPTLEEKFATIQAKASERGADGQLVADYFNTLKGVEAAGTEDNPDTIARLSRLKQNAERVVDRAYYATLHEQVNSGELPFAKVRVLKPAEYDDDGNLLAEEKMEDQLIAGPGVEGKTLTEALQYSKGGGVDFSDALEAQGRLITPAGFDRPLYELERRDEARGMIAALAEGNDRILKMIEAHALVMGKKEDEGLSDKGQRFVQEMADDFTGLTGKMLGEEQAAAAERTTDINLQAHWQDKQFAVGEIARALQEAGVVPAGQEPTQEELADAFEQLAGDFALKNGLYNYDEDDPAANIKKFGYGTVQAHPALMANKALFEEAIENRPDLGEGDKMFLRDQRDYHMVAQFDQYNEILSRSSFADEWQRTLQQGRRDGTPDTQILDRFVNEDPERYSPMKARLGGLGHSAVSAVESLFTFVPAAFGAEWARERLVKSAEENSARREVARVFGDDFGFGYDIAETIAPLVVDLGATALVSAAMTPAGGASALALKQGTKITAKGYAKALTSSVFRPIGGETAEAAAKRIANIESLIVRSSRKKVSAMDVINTYNSSQAMALPRATAAFLPAANRSAGATYGAVYSALKDNPDIPEEEVHNRALGAAFMSGAITGTITASFGAIGRGGIEDAVLGGASRKQLTQLTKALAPQNGAEMSDDVFSRVLSKVLSDGFRKTGLPSLLKDLGKNAADEAMEEGLDEFVSSFVQDSALNENTPILDRLQQSFVAASIGGILGAGSPLITRGVEKIKESSASFDAGLQAREKLVQAMVAPLEEAKAPMTADAVRNEVNRRLNIPARMPAAAEARRQRIDPIPPLEETPEAPPETAPPTVPAPDAARQLPLPDGVEPEPSPTFPMPDDPVKPEAPEPDAARQLPLPDGVEPPQGPQFPMPEDRRPAPDVLPDKEEIALDRSLEASRRKREEVQKLAAREAAVMERMEREAEKEAERQANAIVAEIQENTEPDSVEDAVATSVEADADLTGTISIPVKPPQYRLEGPAAKAQPGMKAFGAENRTLVPFSGLKFRHQETLALQMGLSPEEHLRRSARRAMYLEDRAPLRPWMLPDVNLDREQPGPDPVSEKLGIKLKRKLFHKGAKGQEEIVAASRLVALGFPVRLRAGHTHGMPPRRSFADISDHIAEQIYKRHPIQPPKDTKGLKTWGSTRKLTFYDPTTKKVKTGSVKGYVDEKTGRGIFHGDPIVAAEMIAENVPVYIPKDFDREKMNKGMYVIKGNRIYGVFQPDPQGMGTSFATQRGERTYRSQPDDKIYAAHAAVANLFESGEERTITNGAYTINANGSSNLQASAEGGALSIFEIMESFQAFIWRATGRSENSFGSEVLDAWLTDSKTQQPLLRSYRTSALSNLQTDFQLYLNLFEARQKMLSIDGLAVQKDGEYILIREGQAREILIAAMIKDDPKMIATKMAPMVGATDTQAQKNPAAVINTFIERLVLNNKQFKDGNMPSPHSLANRSGGPVNRYIKQQANDLEVGQDNFIQSFGGLDDLAELEAAGALEVDNENQFRVWDDPSEGADFVDQVAPPAIKASEAGRFLENLNRDLLGLLKGEPELQDDFRRLSVELLADVGSDEAVIAIRDMPFDDLFHRVINVLHTGNWSHNTYVLEFLQKLRVGRLPAGNRMAEAFRFHEAYQPRSGTQRSTDAKVEYVQREGSGATGRRMSKADAKGMVDLMNNSTRLAISNVTEATRDAANTANTTDAQALGLVSGDPESVVRALTQISESSDNDNHRLVARLLLEDPSFLSSIQFTMAPFKDNFAGAYYRNEEGGHHVLLNLNGHNGRGLESVLLEEYVHAFLNQTITSDPALLTREQRLAVKRLEGLMKLVRKQLAAGDFADFANRDSFDNLDEFVADFLLSDEMQANIRGLDEGSGDTSLFRRIINSLVRMFRRVTGTEIDRYQDALDDIVNLARVPVPDSRLHPRLLSDRLEVEAEAQLQLARRAALNAPDSLRLARGLKPIPRDENGDPIESEIDWLEQSSLEAEGDPVLPDTPLLSNNVNPDIDPDLLPPLSPDEESDIEGNPGIPSKEADTQRMIELGRIAITIIKAKLGVTLADGKPGDAGVGFVLDFRPNQKAIWSEGGVVVVNPARLAEALAGLDARARYNTVEAVLDEELGHISSFNELTQEEVDAVSRSLSESDLDDVLASYYEGAPTGEASARAALADGDVAMRRRMTEEFLRQKLDRSARGFTTEEDIAFWRTNPGLPSIYFRYIAGVFRRLAYNVGYKRYHNPRVAAAVNRMAVEMRLIKAGYRSASTTVPFDSEAPMESLAAMERTMREDPAEDAVSLELASSLGQGGSNPDLNVDLSAWRELFDVPLYESGEGARPDSYWKRLFLGDTSPQLQRYARERDALLRSGADLLSNWHGTLEKLVAEAYGESKVDGQGNTLPHWELISRASGSTRMKTNDRATLTDAQMDAIEDNYQRVLEALNANREIAMSAAASESNAAKRKAARDKAKDDWEAGIKAATEAKEAEISNTELVNGKLLIRETEGAMQQLVVEAPKVAAHITRIREEVITPIQTKMENTYQVGQNSFGVKVSLSGTAYLTRSYRAFNEAGYLARVRHDDEYAQTRANAVAYFEKFYRQQAIEDQLLKGKSKAEAEIEVDNYLRSVTGHTVGQEMLTAFLESYSTGSDSTGGGGRGSDSNPRIDPLVKNLKAQQNLAEPVRELLGEYDAADAVNSIIRTGSVVTTMAAQQSFLWRARKWGIESKTMVEAADYLAWKDGRKRSRDSQNNPIRDMGNPDSLKYGGWKTENDPDWDEFAYDNWVPLTGDSSGVPTSHPLSDLYVPEKEQQGMNQFFRSATMTSYEESAQHAVRQGSRILHQMTGLSMAAKTLGSAGFFLRNLVGSLTFFPWMQGFSDYTSKTGLIRTMNSELTRSLAANRDIDADRVLLNGLGVIGDEITTTAIRELLQRNNVDPESMIEKIISTVRDSRAGKVSETAVTTTYSYLRDQSNAIDALFKISYFYNEVSVLQEARAYAQANNIDSPEAKMTDSELSREAAELVRKTAQSASMTPPLIKRLGQSGFGVVAAPFLRFMAEIPRITYNTFAIAKTEMRSVNPVIQKRGRQRLSGAMGVIILSTAVPTLMRALAGVGDEEDESLRATVPEYLRSNTFFFWGDASKADEGGLVSWDLTFLNPFAIVIDPFLRIMEAGFEGNSTKAANAVVDGVFGNYLGEQILAGAVMDARDNRDATTEKPIWEATDPVGIRASKLLGYVFKESYSPRLLEDGIKAMEAAETDAQGFDDTPLGVILQGIYPVRKHTVEPKAQMVRFLRERAEQWGRLGGLKYELMQDKGLSADDIEDIYETEVVERRNVMAYLTKIVEGFEGLGISKEEANAIMVDTGMSKNRVKLLRRGFYDRPTGSKEWLRKLYEAEDIPGEERARAYVEAVRRRARFLRFRP